MSRRKVFLYIFVSLVAIVVLVAGGYALYRLGYTHGAEGASHLPFDRRFMPDFDRRSAPDFWHWRSNVRFPFVGIIPGLFSSLVFVAIIALAIYGGIKLLRPESRNGRQLPDSRTPRPTEPVDSPPEE
jgi:hypothetical protein